MIPASLAPEDGQDAKFAQIHVLDSEEQLNRRMDIFDNGLDRGMLQSIQTALERVNPHVQLCNSIDIEQALTQDFQLNALADGNAD